MAGMIQVYCGDGKGKTTAAIGQALRCAGSGKNVLIMQLMKPEDSGERMILRQCDNITLWDAFPDAKFSFQMTAQERQTAALWYTDQFRKMTEIVQHGYQMLVLDELTSCVTCGFIPSSLAFSFLDDRPKALEIVITGRSPSKALLEQADYITEMKKVKHPFDLGIAARHGIEY